VKARRRITRRRMFQLTFSQVEEGYQRISPLRPIRRRWTRFERGCRRKFRNLYSGRRGPSVDCDGSGVSEDRLAVADLLSVRQRSDLLIEQLQLQIPAGSGGSWDGRWTGCLEHAVIQARIGIACDEKREIADVVFSNGCGTSQAVQSDETFHGWTDLIEAGQVQELSDQRTGPGSFPNRRRCGTFAEKRRTKEPDP